MPRLVRSLNVRKHGATLARGYALTGIVLAAAALGATGERTANAGGGPIWCYWGSTGSPAAFSSQTVCTSSIYLLTTNSTLYKGSSTLASVTKSCFVPVVLCSQAVAGEVYGSSGGIHLVAGTHAQFFPPGYTPQTSTDYSSYLFSAP